MPSNLRSIALLGLVALAGACAESTPPPDSGLEQLSLASVQPGTLVPGTRIEVRGSSFVEEAWGASELRLVGTFTANGGTPQAIDAVTPATFVDFETMEARVDAALFGAFGEDGRFEGEARIEVLSAVDGEVYATAPLPVSILVRAQLTPRIDRLQDGGVIFVNEAITVEGEGLLLGADEGETVAVVEGCVTRGEGGCQAVEPVSVPVVPIDRFDRTRGTFAFVPAIAGIAPGRFTGTVSLRNQHAGGAELTTDSMDVGYELIESTVLSVSPASASLGQYVEIEGGGFVGGDAGGSTLIRLVGEFRFSEIARPVSVDLTIVPEFVSGTRVRYVINEQDALGQSINLRGQSGSFTGELTPIVAYGDREITGAAAPFELGIAPVKQVVYVLFRPSYVESLRHFGVRGVDALIRERVVEVVERDFRTVNLEVRTEPPTDFALYSIVEIAGPDPNGLGLFGYDNSPGKDRDNLRLYDRIGGVNAQTQEDSYPGFGGVFIESLFGFSRHPEGRAESLPGASDTFDAVFDTFRPDRDGDRATAADVAALGGVPTTGDACPGEDRTTRLGCAVWILGSLIGNTLSHEIGHSLGLANPYGEGFHNLGDEPNRLMDSGGARPFEERAELEGQGPASFCVAEYEYLRRILRTDDPEDPTPRPPCF